MYGNSKPDQNKQFYAMQTDDNLLGTYLKSTHTENSYTVTNAYSHVHDKGK